MKASDTWSQSWTWASAGVSKGDTYPRPLEAENVEKWFLCCKCIKSQYRRSIYASFWENVVSFWGILRHPCTGELPLDSAGDLRPSYPLIEHPWKESCLRPWSWIGISTLLLSRTTLGPGGVLFIRVHVPLHVTNLHVYTSIAQAPTKRDGHRAYIHLMRGNWAYTRHRSGKSTLQAFAFALL